MFMCIYTTMYISFFFFYFLRFHCRKTAMTETRVWHYRQETHQRGTEPIVLFGFFHVFFPARQEATCHAYLSSLSLVLRMCVFLALSLPLASFRLLGLMYRLVVRWCWCVCHEYNCKKLSLSHPSCPRLDRQRMGQQGYAGRRESRDDSH